MAYSIRYVIDVQNVIQAMPPDRKTFGYGLGIAKGASAGGQLVAGPYNSVTDVIEEYGSNSEAARLAQTYFSGGWYGKPLEFYVSIVDTETVESLPQWTVANSYTDDDKVQDDGNAYICVFPHVSSGTFSTDLWKSVTEAEATGAEEWAMNTKYEPGTYVKVTDAETSQAAYYQCVYEHTSEEEFRIVCWEAYTPTGRPIADIMQDILQSKVNYYIVLPSKEFSVQECVDISAAIEASTNSKTAMYSRSDAGLIDSAESTDLASRLKALNYDRSMVIYDPLTAEGQSEYVNAAVASGYATVDFTAARPMLVQANKKLKGVTALDLKSAVYSVLKGKNCNFYTKTTDIDTAMFIDAKMASGQFFDTIQCADWIAYNILYELVNLQQTMASIPFNTNGLKMVYKCIETVAIRALNANVIASGYDSEDNYIENGYRISVPDIADIDKTDKAKRILRNVQSTFLMAGSMQSITITNDIQL